MNYLFRAIKHYFIICCVVFAICVGCVVVVNKTAQPKYQGTASLVAAVSANVAGATYNELLANQMLTKTYEDAIKSRYVAHEVKRRLRLEESVSSLLQRVSVRTDPGTLVVVLNVIDDNPREAVEVANAFASSFIEKSTDIVEGANIIILDYANIDDASIPVSPKKMFNLAIGVFIGFFAAIGIALLLEKGRDARKARRELKKAAQAKKVEQGEQMDAEI